MKTDIGTAREFAPTLAEFTLLSGLSRFFTAFIRRHQITTRGLSVLIVPSSEKLSASLILYMDLRARRIEILLKAPKAARPSDLTFTGRISDRILVREEIQKLPPHLRIPSTRHVKPNEFWKLLETAEEEGGKRCRWGVYQLRETIKTISFATVEEAFAFYLAKFFYYFLGFTHQVGKLDIERKGKGQRRLSFEFAIRFLEEFKAHARERRAKEEAA